MIGILAIGTEITTGQILNTNSQWLSIELLALGIQTSYQIAVPDSPHEIKEALHFLENRASIIIVTGGLGPTADDFTRKVLAEKYQLPLVWNEENWVRVQAKLNAKGVQIRTIHRQQCEFPQDCTILLNNAGVADGFTFKIPRSKASASNILSPSNIPSQFHSSSPSHSQSQEMAQSQEIEIFVLPGPPKEIVNIWQNGVRDQLNKIIPESQKWIQKQWTTKGLPESEVATLINEALGEASLKVLYRAHTPFIDVKLLFQKKEEEINESHGQKITQALGPWLYEQ